MKFRFRYILFAAFILGGIKISSAQNKRIDSLETCLKNSAGDTTRLRISLKLAEEKIKAGQIENAAQNINYCLSVSSDYFSSTDKMTLLLAKRYFSGAKYLQGVTLYKQGNYEGSLKLHNEALKIREEILKNSPDSTWKLYSKTILSDSWNGIGSVNYYLGNYDEAVKNFNSSLRFSLESKNNFGSARAYGWLGNIYNSKGNFPEALKNYFAGVKIHEDSGNKRGMAVMYSGIGNVFSDLGNYEDALTNLKKAIDICEELGDKDGAGQAYGLTGLVYSNMNKHSEALINHMKSKELFEATGDNPKLAIALGNIGVVYNDLKNYKEALKYHMASLEIKKSSGFKEGLANSYLNIGLAYFSLKNYIPARENLMKALETSTEINYREYIRDSYFALYGLDSATGNLKAAFDDYKNFISWRDSLVNEENTKKSVQAQMQYEFGKKESEAKAEQEKKDLKAEEEKRKQKLILWFTVSGLLVVLALAGIILRSLILNKKKNKIISEQKEIVERQKHVVEEKQKEILDSIYYARRIQRSLLTNEKYIERKLNQLTKN